MNLRKEEITALRTLAQEYMEIASLPVQKEKMELWKAFNRHDNTSHGAYRPASLA